MASTSPTGWPRRSRTTRTGSGPAPHSWSTPRASRPGWRAAAGPASCRRSRQSVGPSSSAPANRSRKPASGSVASSASAAGGRARLREITPSCLRHRAAGWSAVGLGRRVTQLHDLTALEQAAAVRAGDVRRPSSSSTTCAASRRSTPASARSSRSPPSARCAPRPRASGRCGRAATAPAARRPDGDQGPHNTAGVRTTFGSVVMADFVPSVDDAVVTAAGRGRHDQPRQDQHLRVRLPLLHRHRAGRPGPVPRGTPPAPPAAPAAARPWPSRPGCCRSRTAATAAARSASRPASTACSASSPVAAGSATHRSAPT